MNLPLTILGGRFMLRLFMLCVALFLTSCFFKSVSHDPERTNEVMITFVTKARAGFWREAMENVTPEEREEMMDGGNVLPEYKDAISRIRLSTIGGMDLGLDSKGRLVGIIDILDQSNGMVRANADRVEIDPSKLKDVAAEQQKKKQEEEERFRKELEENPEEEDPDASNFLEKLLKETPKDE